MSFSTCKNDNLIGPNVSGCRDDFDFTVKFELVVFSIVPSAIFVILALWRSFHLSRKPAIINEPAFQLLKSSCITAYLGLQLALLVLVATCSFDVTALSISSTVLRFLAAIGLVPLSLLEHSRSARPSVLLNAYLFLSLLFDITQTRTFWLASGTRSEKANTALFTASVALEVIILLLEARRKRSFVKWDEKEHSPEETSGLYSLGVFFWLNRVFIDGYSKILQIDDLYPLDSGMRGRVLDERFARHAEYSKMKGHKYGLLKALCRTLLVELLLPIVPRLLLLGFMFCQPFFIDRLLTYLSEPEGPNSSNFAYGFIGVAVLIYSGIAVSTALYWYFHYRTLLKARGILVSAVYKKTLEAQIGTSDSTAAITLMSTDIERINVCFRSVHDVWASFLETGLASYLLYLQIGAAFAAPLVAILCCILGISVVVRYTGDAQRKWMAAIQRRVGLTSTVIANTKNLKLSGLTEPVANSIQQLRIDEIASGSRFRKLLITSAFFGWAPGVIAPFVTFAFASQQLGTTKIFTSLSFVILLADPLAMIFQNIPQIMHNIIGFSEFDAKRYREVLLATMLDVDLETLPSGEMTNVGSNGITLSGGQKQRVSLARALYLQSDLLILDDIFSGLDADTEEQVFQRVFGPDGIARRRNSTAILMTHSVKHLPAADHIVALSIEGTVTEQGTFPELMANDGYIRGLGINSAGSDTSSEKTTNLFSQDLNLIDMELPNSLLNALLGCFEVIAGAAVIMSSAPAIARFYLRTSRQMRLLDLEAKSPLYTHFRDTSHGIESVRAFDFTEEDREKNRQLLDTSQRPAYLLVMTQQWLVMVMNFVVMVLCVILTSLAVKLRSNSGFTGASLVSLMTFGNQIAWTIVFYTQLETSITEVNEGEEPDLALKNVNLTITSGEKVAICGRTGSGKSSLIAYLLKLLDPMPGKAALAHIDQTSLDSINRPTLRHRIIAIPQEAVFLPDGSTFRANLDPFGVATEADCRSVLETVDLWAFVEDRGGLEAGISAGTFSQGQRQIFSLARAVLRRRIRARGLGIGLGESGQGATAGEGGVLLLDEVSSSVDLETERLMQNIIHVEFQKYTMVAVSHRLDMIMDFDRVVGALQGRWQIMKAWADDQAKKLQQASDLYPQP
ncbi:hypothetical protein PG994_006419, partial [Apiospora phragmitis]